MSSEPLLNRRAAAERIKGRGIPTEASTLAKLASIGGGPSMRKFGRRVFYEAQALEAWIDEKLTVPRKSTSDVGGKK